jgi:hypothetical protein
MSIQMIIKDNWKQIIPFALGVGLTVLLYPTANIETKAYERSKAEYTKELQSVTDKHEIETFKMQQNYEEEVKVLIAESTKTESDLKQKIVSLNTEISTNAKKQHTEVVKITRPDGTIEEHTITDTSEESMNQRIVDMKKETEQQVKTEIAKVQEEFTKKEEQIKTESNKIVATLQVTIEKQKSQIDELIKKETIVSINPKAVGIEAGIASDLMYRFGANYNVLGPIYIGIQTDSDFKTKVRPGVTIGVRF